MYVFGRGDYTKQSRATQKSSMRTSNMKDVTKAVGGLEL